jgi:choice-of-anchor B domain-containing protein
MQIRRNQMAVIAAASLTLIACLGTTIVAHDGESPGDAYEGPGFLGGDGAGMKGVPDDFPSSNVTLLSWLTVEELFAGASHANDCWGYTSPSGREYALVGLDKGTAIVDISDPDRARRVAFVQGTESIWRDMKTYDEYAYIVTEGRRGREGSCVDDGVVAIQVLDLGSIDDDVVTLVGDVVEEFDNRTHNIAIDETSGFLYRCGGDVRPGPLDSSRGLRIYDLADPGSPTLVGEWNERYVHDAQIVTYTDGPYAGRQIAFCATQFSERVDPDNECGPIRVSTSRFFIVDVTDKTDIRTLAELRYRGARYTHQGWLSEDRRYFYLNDELDEFNDRTTRTFVIDVSDLENPVEIGAFGNGGRATDHNLYVRGDRIFEANYRSGLRVFDASDPVEPVEIAFFDTHPEGENTPGFDGLWGNYPFFPSGAVIGSDGQRGLFVWWVGEALLRLSFPDGEPVRLAADGHPVRVAIDGAVDELVPGSVRVAYSLGEEYETIELERDADGDFRGQFPELVPGSTLSLYLVAETRNGIEWREPPNGVLSATVALADECADGQQNGDSCGPWSSRIVGAPQFSGGFHATDDCVEIAAASGEIARSSQTGESFVFAHQSVESDFVLTARLESWEVLAESAEVALVVRESHEGVPRSHSVVLRAREMDFLHRFFVRLNDGGTGIARARETFADPRIWMRIERTGERISSQVSIDGETWSAADGIDFPGLARPVHVGLAAAFEATEIGGERSVARFCDVQLERLGARRFLRGDCNGSGDVDISDAVCILVWLFLGQPSPGCLSAANVNGDGNVDIADPSFLLNHLFTGGPPPPAPFGDCAVSSLPGDEVIGCATTTVACQ